MSNKDYLASIEASTDLRSEMRKLSLIGNEVFPTTKLDYVTGQESFSTVFSSVKSIGSSTMNFAKWSGGKLGNGLSKAFYASGVTLGKAIGANQMLLSSVKGLVNEETLVKLNEKQVMTLTIDGSEDDLLKGPDLIMRALKDYATYTKALDNYLNEQLVTISKLKKVKTASDIAKVVSDFEDIKLPKHDVFKEGNNTGVLPGGKTISITLEEGNVKYIMSGGDKVTTALELTLSVSDKKELLNKLSNINAMFKHIKQSYENYSKFIKSWQDTVMQVAKNLDNLENVPNGTLHSAQSILGGSSDALLFYSGFTPRVMTYTDKYFQTLVSVVRK